MPCCEGESPYHEDVSVVRVTGEKRRLGRALASKLWFCRRDNQRR